MSCLKSSLIIPVPVLKLDLVTWPTSPDGGNDALASVATLCRNNASCLNGCFPPQTRQNRTLMRRRRAGQGDRQRVFPTGFRVQLRTCSQSGTTMFSQTVEYALRAVVHLAQHSPSPQKTSEIAEATKVRLEWLEEDNKGGRNLW